MRAIQANLFASLTILLCIGVGSTSALAGATLDAISTTLEPIRDGSGNIRYFVLLNEEIAAKHPVDDERPPVSTRDPQARTDPRSWHRASVRRLVKVLEAQYQIAAVNMTSWAVPAFSAHLSPKVLAELREDPRIVRIAPIHHDEVRAATFADYCSTNETVSWGKTAVGADDGGSTANVVYMVDGNYPGHGDLQGVIDRPIVNSTYLDGANHALHVAGILTATAGGGGTRGINPGATVFAVRKGHNYADHNVAFDWILADSEQHGTFGVVNISAAGPGFSSSGISSQFFRRMSNRLLVVQSAGNHRVNACTRAYGPANDYDGILVVGGTDEIGKWAAPYDNSSTGYESGAGTNWGECVEVWAPSQRIKSSWSTGTATLSGTSTAAPHVAGLAARYGSSQTRPLEREQFIRAKLKSTGHSDMGRAIAVPVLTEPSAFQVPTRLGVIDATAGSTVTGSSPWHAADGLYLSNYWTSGLFPNDYNTWIQFDLGSSRTVKAVRMTPEQSPEYSGSVVHKIYVGDTLHPTTLVATYSGPSTILEPLLAMVGGAVGRYVRIHTTSGPSWVAWREIEIYGN